MTTDITWDAEASNLLNNNSIDYTASPYKLKDDFDVHCIVIEEHQTEKIIAFYDGDTIPLDGTIYEGDGEYTSTLKDYEPIKYEHRQLHEFKEYIENNKIRRVIAHNQINYDLLLCKLYFGMDYTIEEDTWCGKKVDFHDTMVIAKTLNPDRKGGASLDNLGKFVGKRKYAFRKFITDDKRFVKFAPDMLYYNIVDVKVNTRVYKYLEDEKGKWDWNDAIKLEKAVAEIITRQEHRGFAFDSKLAQENLKELDALMKERREKVTPLLPPKPATKTFMKDFTPPVKQFLQSGLASANLNKFVAKIGAELILDEDERPTHMVFRETTYDLPLPLESLVTTQEADIDDSTHIKNWLVGLGWNPSEYKIKDLTYKQKAGVGKVKRTREEYEKAVENYVEQTLKSNFLSDRCDHLKVKAKDLKDHLLNKKMNRSVIVLTNPSFTVGQDKDMCPDLERVSDKFPFAKDVVEYLTYKHRRNSILGGGLDYEDGEDADKGYLAYIREDGRIPTPADTCGAASSRFKHRLVANIPRVTSLYGNRMRAMFGVDEDFYQVGYDFDSLEAKEEASYCWKYDPDKTYCNSLTAAKPNDIHTVTARKISEIIRRDFERGSAKAVKYGCTYGASAPKVAKIIGSDIKLGAMVYNAFWDAAEPLQKLKNKLTQYWENIGEKEFILGIDGRKVPTRSPHSILNSLFQSAGVICAKRAMVIHDRKLRAAGLLVDFFKDDWKNQQFAQQLIAYHDESQLETHKSLVKFKTASSEAAIKKFKEEQEEKGVIWGDVQRRGDKYYVAYCLAGVLAVEAVKEAGEYYDLNVPLTAGYMVGKNWEDCH